MVGDYSVFLVALYCFHYRNGKDLSGFLTITNKVCSCNACIQIPNSFTVFVLLDLLSLKVKVKGVEVKFTIFKRTECRSVGALAVISKSHIFLSLLSIYGISEGSGRGLVVCNYPNGVMVAVCPGSPSVMNKAVPLLENFILALRQ